MSINESQYKIDLCGIVNGLRSIFARHGRGDDSASVQINTDGKCILRVGLGETRMLTVPEFAKYLDQVTTRALEGDNNVEHFSC